MYTKRPSILNFPGVLIIAVYREEVEEMSTASEEATRGPSAPLASQVIEDIEGTETGAMSDEQQWPSNGSGWKKEESIGRSMMSSIPTSTTSSSRKRGVSPIVSVLISFASLSLMLSAISLALTCVAVTTSATQRRVGVVAAEELALYKARTNNDSETIRNEVLAPGSAYRTQKKDTKTSVHRPLSSSSSRRLSDPNVAASAAAHSVHCQCTEISQVTLEPPVAAHVSGADTNADLNPGIITTWQNKDGASDKIQCRDGRLVALEGGLYAVYSQLYIILYPEEGEERGEDGTDSFWHSVYRWHPSDGKSVGGVENATELMKRVWTVTWRKDIGEVSSHLAGVFNLSSNDELTVRWSKSEKFHIHPDQKVTYFGMFKIR